jgi:hypothetical protein
MRYIGGIMMKTKRFAAAVASLGIIASVSAAVPASVGLAAEYIPVSGEYVSFEKYLVMDKNATVPNVGFDFSVAPITDDLAGTDGNIAVKKGVSGIKFKDGVSDVEVNQTDNAKATVSFKSSDSTIAENEKGDFNGDARVIGFVDSSDTTNEKFAVKNVTLDLTGVSFPEPGIYRYIITETNAENIAGVAADEDPVRYLDVYVENDTESDGLKVVGSFLHTGTDAPSASQHKSTGFTNKYQTNNITFEKVVKGNQGSKDKYFKFTLQLTKEDATVIDDNDTFTLDGSYDKTPIPSSMTVYSADEMAVNNVASVKYSQLKGDGYDFYLKSGQEIIVYGVPLNMGYVITETQEEYEPTVVMADDGDCNTDDKTGEGTIIAGAVSADKKTFSITDSYLGSNAEATFTNTKEGTIPTGVLMSVAGSAAIAAIGIAGIVAGSFYLKKKRSEDEE